MDATHTKALMLFPTLDPSFRRLLGFIFGFSFTTPLIGFIPLKSVTMLIYLRYTLLAYSTAALSNISLKSCNIRHTAALKMALLLGLATSFFVAEHLYLSVEFACLSMQYHLCYVSLTLSWVTCPLPFFKCSMSCNKSHCPYTRLLGRASMCL